MWWLNVETANKRKRKQQIPQLLLFFYLTTRLHDVRSKQQLHIWGCFLLSVTLICNVSLHSLLFWKCNSSSTINIPSVFACQARLYSFLWSRPPSYCQDVWKYLIYFWFFCGFFDPMIFDRIFFFLNMIILPFEKDLFSFSFHESTITFYLCENNFLRRATGLRSNLSNDTPSHKHFNAPPLAHWQRQLTNSHLCWRSRTIISLMQMSLGCWRKSKCPDNPGRHWARTYNLQT